MSENIEIEKELQYYGLEGKWNDYIGLQKKVVSTLREEHFFEKPPIINEETGMEIRITAKGIRETLGSGNRFQTLPKKLKINKVATIRSLPELIRKGYVIADDVKNSHSENGYLYAYIGNSIMLDGRKTNIRIAIKKKIGSNHFWIHNIDECKNSLELLSPSERRS